MTVETFGVDYPAPEKSETLVFLRGAAPPDGLPPAGGKTCEAFFGFLSFPHKRMIVPFSQSGQSPAKRGRPEGGAAQ